MTEEQLREIAIGLKSKMYQAFADDHKANKNGKPALNKMMALD